MSRTLCLLAALLSLACPTSTPPAPCRRVPAVAALMPPTFVVSSRQSTRFTLQAPGLTCDDTAELITEATLTTARGERRRLVVQRVSLSLLAQNSLDLELEVPPTPEGSAALRVFIEPGLAVLDATLLSPVERADEPGLSFTASPCDVLAISASQTRYCTRAGQVTVQRGSETTTWPGLTSARAVGAIVWTLQPLGAGVHELKRWRERSDGGLDELGAAPVLRNELHAVTERQALTSTDRWVFEDDGGAKADPVRQTYDFCAGVLEPTNVFLLGLRTVCDGLDGTCLNAGALRALRPTAFDERSLWLIDDPRFRQPLEPVRLTRFSRPLRSEATESGTLQMPVGYGNERFPCDVQGSAPLLLRDQDRGNLLLVRDTEAGLVSERFAAAPVVSVTRDWLVLGADGGVHRAFSLRP